LKLRQGLLELLAGRRIEVRLKVEVRLERLGRSGVLAAGRGVLGQRELVRGVLRVEVDELLADRGRLEEVRGELRREGLDAGVVRLCEGVRNRMRERRGELQGLRRRRGRGGCVLRGEG